MSKNTEPLQLGEWLLYKDTGSLFHTICKRFHNTKFEEHACIIKRIDGGDRGGRWILIPFFIITTTNICRQSLRGWGGCTLPLIEKWKGG